MGYFCIVLTLKRVTYQKAHCVNKNYESQLTIAPQPRPMSCLVRENNFYEYRPDSAIYVLKLIKLHTELK